MDFLKEEIDDLINLRFQIYKMCLVQSQTIGENLPEDLLNELDLIGN